jgi:hypothetical protein
VHTRIARLKQAIASLRYLDLRVHGLVLWNDNLPVIEAQDDIDEPKRSVSDSKYGFAGAR